VKVLFMPALRIFTALTMAWATVALAAQVVLARGGGRQDFSRRAGHPGLGVLYNFTTAMLPSHKETARLHPAEFVAGMVLHLGILASLAEVLALLVMGAAAPWFIVPRLFAAGGAITSLGLFVRRVRSPLLRKLSTPDDYLAVLATTGLLAIAAFPFPVFASGAPLLGYAALIFLYTPLGKLRHAVFFFVARGEYGWRLGHRGIYPPGGSE
jgi:hypothetical protein